MIVYGVSAAAIVYSGFCIALDPDHVLALVQSVSVAEYCRSFCERVVKGQYGGTLAENRRLAGEQFVCKPLMECTNFDTLDCIECMIFNMVPSTGSQSDTSSCFDLMASVGDVVPCNLCTKALK